MRSYSSSTACGCPSRLCGVRLKTMCPRRLSVTCNTAFHATTSPFLISSPSTFISLVASLCHSSLVTSTIHYSLFTIHCKYQLTRLTRLSLFDEIVQKVVIDEVGFPLCPL